MDPLTSVVQLVALGLCLWIESLVPLFMDRPKRALHVGRNVFIGLINGILLTLLFYRMVSSAAQWGTLHRFGLLQWFDLPPNLKGIVGFLLFDLWMYGWHRANHRMPFLWRFHRMHHSDLALDASSSSRFHIGEMILSTLLRLAVVPLLGITLKNLVFYELILGPVIVFHHSNIALPERWDRWVRLFVVSPNMHRVHHSDLPAETNSNYASILSLWDRLWKTYRQRDVMTIRFGLKEFEEPRWQTVAGMVLTPTA